jgi:hypothetical protein
MYGKLECVSSVVFDIVKELVVEISHVPRGAGQRLPREKEPGQ